MKLLLLSFVVGLGVGGLYGLIRVKSPAPPIVALLGLLGMVLGEQLGGWILTKMSAWRMPHPFVSWVSIGISERRCSP
jgi:XapX domain-containing protein